MKTQSNSKKSFNPLFVGIFLFILLFGIYVLFSDENSNSPIFNFENQKSNKEKLKLSQNKIFELEDINIGTENKQVLNFPITKIGNYEDYKTIFSSKVEIDENLNLNLNLNNQTKNFLVYFNLEEEENFNLIYAGNNYFINSNSQSPLKIKYEKGINRITLNKEKTGFFSFLKNDKLIVEDFRVIEINEIKNPSSKNIVVNLDKKELKSFKIKFNFDCKRSKDMSKPFRVFYKDELYLETIPKCEENENNVIELPFQNYILENKENTFVVQSDGNYQFSYLIEKHTTSKKNKFEFFIDNFNNFYDVEIYAEMDNNIAEVEINGKSVIIQNEKRVSISDKIRFANNDIKFLTIPLNIKKLEIIKVEY